MRDESIYIEKKVFGAAAQEIYLSRCSRGSIIVLAQTDENQNPMFNCQVLCLHASGVNEEVETKKHSRRDAIAFGFGLSVGYVLFVPVFSVALSISVFLFPIDFGCSVLKF